MKAHKELIEKIEKEQNTIRYLTNEVQLLSDQLKFHQDQLELLEHTLDQRQRN